ncbi:hypothetical protein IWQ60_008375 [Tieghemiomyces parasiticus]|uniref:Uncharacterized protein n=1 Tax=Tieghemiomyces parasiticus TaxID=78921 RepID=A0A9W8A0G9_9FUNG|nr:hypothetical protein IWQ60_008375 [Tieghemiomyces parasiticus]
MDPSYSTPTHPAEPVDSASSELASAPTEIAVSGTHVDEDIVAEDSDQGGDGESEDEDEASRYTGYAQLGDEAFGDFETASVEASDDESTVATTEPTGEESKSEAETSYLHIGNRRIEVVVKPDRAISDEKADLIKSIMARLQLSDRAVPGKLHLDRPAH